MSFYLIIIFLFFGLSRNFLKKLGIKRMYFEALRFKAIQHGLTIHKEISLMKLQEIFTNFFTTVSNNFTRVLFKESLIGRSPKIWLELIAVTGLAIFLIVLINKNYSNENIIIISSLYTVAAFRLIPSINRIVTSAIQLKYNHKVIDLIYNIFVLSADIKKHDAEIKINENIELQDINFGYYDKKPILNNINFKIKKGDFIALYGDTGSGKTTLLNIILGLISCNSGQILIDGKKQSQFFYQNRKFGLVSQNIELIDTTILENITFKNNISKEEQEKINKIILVCSLSDFLKELPNGIHENVGEGGIKVSGGQKQRIVLARALFFEPDLLVLDEATSALDSKTEEIVLKNIKENYQDKLVIFISHRKEVKKYCNRMFLLNNFELKEEISS